MWSVMLRHCARFAAGIALGALVMASPPASAAGGADSSVYSVNASPFGASYAEWSARQWQWLFSLPVTAHPLFETADCSAGQTGNVWFLGGTFLSTEVGPGVFLGEASRDCTIPSGTALFFPIADVECSTLEGNGETEEELRDCANFYADFIVPGSLVLEIDGERLTNAEDYRVESPLFTYGPLPEENVLGAPAGATTPAVSDGVFVMLHPLSTGTHTIHFRGVIDVSSIGGPVFMLDIAYQITVVPAGQYSPPAP